MNILFLITKIILQLYVPIIIKGKQVSSSNDDIGRILNHNLSINKFKCFNFLTRSIYVILTVKYIFIIVEYWYFSASTKENHLELYKYESTFFIVNHCKKRDP